VFNLKLKGKCAIVTGGLGGIGNATAERFLEEGAHVVVADIRESKRDTFLTQTYGDSVAYFCGDVSKAKEMEALVFFARKTYGRVDVMFNNAGVAEALKKVSLLDEDFAGFERLLAVDLLGPMLGTKYAGRLMREQGSGVIINTASIGGFFSGFGLPVYRAAKAGVISLTQLAATELGQFGIRVNCISPGSIETPMGAAGYPPEVSEQLMKSASKIMLDMQVLKRSGIPADVANAVVFLASDLAAQITGQNLVIDGGATIGDKIDRVELMTAEFANILGNVI
jgi:NAD(P)-dependent dehydrogenase (short-subunit alcohol dehydrogenase family)